MVFFSILYNLYFYRPLSPREKEIKSDWNTKALFKKFYRFLLNTLEISNVLATLYLYFGMLVSFIGIILLLFQ